MNFYRCVVVLAFTVLVKQHSVAALSTEMTGPAVTLAKVASGLDSPIQLLFAKLPTSAVPELFIAQQTGRISRVSAAGDVSLFAKIPGIVTLNNYDERGLLGLAFHPQFETNGRFFVHYIGPPPSGVTEVTGVSGVPAVGCTSWNESTYNSVAYIEEWNAAFGGSPRKVRSLLTIKQVFFNHDGHSSLFIRTTGKATFLYVSIGDGGLGFDVFNLAQSDDHLRGKIFTLNVDAITTDCKTILVRYSELQTYCPDTAKNFVLRAKGLRNPSGVVFDAATRTFFFNDVGQAWSEEVNAIKDFIQPNFAVTNFGWRAWEGQQPTVAGDTTTIAYPVEHPRLAGAYKPFAAYTHAQGKRIAVTGIAFARSTVVNRMYRPGVFFSDWSGGGASFGKGTLMFSRPNATDFQAEMPLYTVPIANPTVFEGKSYFYTTMGSSSDNKRIFIGTTANFGPVLGGGSVFELVA